MNRKMLLGLVSAILPLCFAQEPPSLNGNRSELMSRRIAKLEKEVEDLKSSLEATRYILDYSGLQNSPPLTARFTAGDRHYVVTQTSSGHVAVSMGGASVYPGGHRLTLLLMPLTSVTLTNVSLSIGYGPAKQASDDYLQWRRSRKAKLTPREFRLIGSKWNPIQVVLPSSSSTDMEYFEITVQPFGIEPPRSVDTSITQ